MHATAIDDVYKSLLRLLLYLQSRNGK